MKDTIILIVEDESIIRMELKFMLQSQGYVFIHTAESGEQAIEMALSVNPDVILFDIQLKGKLDGIEAANRIQVKSKKSIIFITANPHMFAEKRFKNTNPVGILTKPVEENELFDMIEKVVS